MGIGLRVPLGGFRWRGLGVEGREGEGVVGIRMISLMMVGGVRGGLGGEGIGIEGGVVFGEAKGEEMDGYCLGYV